MQIKNNEQINIVISGHVDHGKSTVIGRLLADANVLPEGKLQAVKNYCEKNAKVFEYAYLLDALKEEQAQGITIDAARCFFRTKNRNYLIFDAPGHFEFIKNMITGASRADFAIIVIDAKDGIKENTRRHGYLVSLLGVKKICVLINKMDLVNYDEKIFIETVNEYSEFLNSIKISDVYFIPVSAREGENIVRKSEKMKWFNGKTLFELIEEVEIASDDISEPFRFFVQDVYKFTEKQDDRRILVGTIDYGKIKKGDYVIFYPSMKQSIVESIENYPEQLECAFAGQSPGFIIKDPLFIQSGELMVKKDEKEKPCASKKFYANIFWLEANPLVVGKTYKAKIGSQLVKIRIVEIKKIIDAVELDVIEKKEYIERYDIGYCIFETLKPVAFDIYDNLQKTSRFVLVEQYRIAGCGIILESIYDNIDYFDKKISIRESLWNQGYIKKEQRELRNKHKGKFIILSGQDINLLRKVSSLLEKELFDSGFYPYFISPAVLETGISNDTEILETDREEELRRLGELARIMTDAGMLFITFFSELDKYELELLRKLNSPSEIIKVNINSGEKDEIWDIVINNKNENEIVKIIIEYLTKEKIIEYYI